MSKKLISIVMSLVLVVGLCPATALADSGPAAGQTAAPLGQSQAQQDTFEPQAAVASPSCMLLRADGNLWRCTAKGAPVSKYWDGSQSLSTLRGKIKTLFIASNVTYVGNTGKMWTRDVWFDGSTHDYDYTTYFDNYSLPNATSVKFVTNSKGVNGCKVINDRAFSGWKKLSTVANFSKTRVTRIGDNAFSRTKIKTLAMPKTLKTMGKYAFQSCKSLTAVSGLSKSKLTKVPNDAFYECTRLKSIALPKTCKVVGDSAFWNCTRLSKVTLGSKTTKIEGWAFKGCQKLGSISLPATCKKIGSSAFSGCSSLKKVVMRSKTMVKHASNASYGMYGVFYNTPIEVKGLKTYIYVPKSTLAKYRYDKYTNKWYDYRTKFRAL